MTKRGPKFLRRCRMAAIVERISDEESRENTKKVLDYLNYLPTFSIFKIGVGFAL